MNLNVSNSCVLRSQIIPESIIIDTSPVSTSIISNKSTKDRLKEMLMIANEMKDRCPDNLNSDIIRLYAGKNPNSIRCKHSGKNWENILSLFTVKIRAGITKKKKLYSSHALCSICGKKKRLLPALECFNKVDYPDIDFDFENCPRICNSCSISNPFCTFHSTCILCLAISCYDSPGKNIISHDPRYYKPATHYASPILDLKLLCQQCYTNLRNKDLRNLYINNYFHLIPPPLYYLKNIKYFPNSDKSKLHREIRHYVKGTSKKFNSKVESIKKKKSHVSSTSMYYFKYFFLDEESFLRKKIRRDNDESEMDVSILCKIIILLNFRFWNFTEFWRVF